MRFGWLPALLCCLWLFCVGCSANEDVITVSRWSFAPPSGLAPATVELPANLANELPEHDCVYWLRTRVELPPEMRDKALVLAFPLFLGASQLFVDGSHEAALLDVENEHAYRAVGGQRFRIPAEWNHGSGIDLALRIEHTWMRSAWIDTSPRLSVSRGGDTWTRSVQIWNQGTAMLAQATISVLFLFYALLFFLDRRQATYGWLALEAFAGASYPSVFDGSALLLFGEAEQLILALGLPIALWASVQFAHAQFKLDRPPRWIDVMLVGVIAVTFAGAGRFSLTRFAGPPIVLSLAVNVLYQMWLTARLWRTQRSYRAGALFLSWAGLGLLSAPDMISWLGFGEILGGLQGGCVGIMFIAALQSVVLGAEHVSYVRQAEDLAHQLAERIGLLEQQHQEVARLNEELYRQMAARSEQLAQALTRLAAGALAEPLQLSEGTLVDERYRVIRAIGSGGMGRVYEVERLVDGMRLALKVLARPDGMAELARFSREAQIAGTLRHPNVVALVDVDVAPTGFLYLIMELVPGTSLREHDQRYGDVPWAMSILRQVSEGLTAIHASGVVHRDLKPANVLIVGDADTQNPCAKITDFGVSSVGGPDAAEVSASSAPRSASRALDLAEKLRAEAHAIELSDLDQTRQPARRNQSSMPAPRSAPPRERESAEITVAEVENALVKAASGSTSLSTSGSTSLNTSNTSPTSPTGRTASFTSTSSSGLTQTGMLIGTPRYMAPELADGARFTTPAVDIFSFGVMAYELLTRTAPYPEPVAVVRMSQREIPPLRPLGSLCPSLAPDVVSLIEQCLETSPELRPSAHELMVCLAANDASATLERASS
ncbi:MAG: serine/threonine-protein kinase [Myxococcales bacterium]